MVNLMKIRNKIIEKIYELLKNHTAFWILLLVVTLTSLFYDNFLISRNISNLLRQNSMLGISAIGLTFVVFTGGIDLSIPSVVALAGVVFAEFSGFGFYTALFAALFAAAICGMLNGILICRTKIAPFIVTLATYYAIKGIVYTYTRNFSIKVIDSPEVTFISRTFIHGIPISFIILVICGIVCALVLHYSSFGRHLLAVGGNEEAAHYMGINVNLVKTAAYTLSSTFTGLGGIILACRLIAAQPMAGEGWDMQALSAIVIGGTLLKGGKGSFIGTILGILTLGIVMNAISLQTSLSSWWQWIVRGGFLLIVVVVQGIVEIYNEKQKNS